MTFPKQIQNLIDAFERLPGIGPKTAERLSFYLLRLPNSELQKLGDAFINLKTNLTYCPTCKNITDKNICDICLDNLRNPDIICVVESPLDVFSLEKSGNYKGLYHVLHGLIDPIKNIGPEELFIDDLIKRLGVSSKQLEIILALNPTMEGEATAMYLRRQFQISNFKFQISRLGVGLPIGGDLQYADETTLQRAMDGRQKYE